MVSAVITSKNATFVVSPSHRPIMKIWLQRFVSIYFFLFSQSTFLKAQEVEIPNIPPPTFSATVGFNTSPFELQIRTSQNGIYTFTVSAQGCLSKSGEVQVVVQDVTVPIVLESNKSALSSSATTEKSPVSATFRENTTRSNVESADDVFIGGTMVNPIWPVPGSSPDMLMIRESEQSPYLVKTFGLLPGEYQYKYFRNNGWGDGEWGGPPNRVVDITGPTVINDYYEHITPPPQPLFTVTFVDTDGNGTPINDARSTKGNIEGESR